MIHILITLEQYEDAINAIKKGREILRKAQEKVAKEEEVIREANESLKENVEIVRTFEEGENLIGYSKLPQSLNALKLSVGCMQLINSVIKSVGPGVKTDRLEEILHYITIDSLRAVSIWGPRKEQEIAEKLGKYGVRI